MPPGPGTRLGPYEITAALGAGGMGEVYKAKDTRLDRIVAIKVLTSHVSYDPADFSIPGGPGIVTSLSYRRGQFPVKTTNAAGHVEYSVYDPVQGLLLPVSDDELVLDEAAASVDPVPVRNAVEGVEEGRDLLQFTGTRAWRLAVPELVEQPHRRTPQEALRHERRGGGELRGAERQGVPARAGRQRVQRRVLAPGQYRAP